MKLSSLAIVAGIAAAFLLFEGWILLERFWLPIEVSSTIASLQGRETDTKTPFAGVVRAIHVREGEMIVRNAVIAVIDPTYPDQNFGDTIVVRALRDGIVADIAVTVGEFVQASQRIAVIQELEEEALFVAAEFPLEPSALRKLDTLSNVRVSADFLNDGEPVRSRVSAVYPQYDPEGETVRARVDFTEPVSSALPMFAGLPVRVIFTMDNPSRQRHLLEVALRKIVPLSTASPISK